MANPTKKKDALPEVRIQDAFDAKGTSSTPEFTMWAMRNGEKDPAAHFVLTRKGETAEKGVLIKRSEMHALRVLLEHFDTKTLPKLDSYGIEKAEEE